MRSSSSVVLAVQHWITNGFQTSFLFNPILLNMLLLLMCSPPPPPPFLDGGKWGKSVAKKKKTFAEWKLNEEILLCDNIDASCCRVLSIIVHEEFSCQFNFWE